MLLWHACTRSCDLVYRRITMHTVVAFILFHINKLLMKVTVEHVIHSRKISLFPSSSSSIDDSEINECFFKGRKDEEADTKEVSEF